jgi:hypothetical protein
MSSGSRSEAVLTAEEVMKMNVHVGSCSSPGAEALHVRVGSDGAVEILANDNGAVVGDEPLFARHVLTLPADQAMSLGSLLMMANRLGSPKSHVR